jgi:phosphoglycerol transferase MdoB-like AlkP superfamily enzyme
MRRAQSGNVFSPEFGGMTANVEFEALSGFSNAFLPYGSIPYQQYVRGQVPSLPSFLKNQGYETVAMHPFEGWFWNRNDVYKSFGFDNFLSMENLPQARKARHADL